MKSRKPSLTYTPFEEIKELLKAKSISLRENDPVHEALHEEVDRNLPRQGAQHKRDCISGKPRPVGGELHKALECEEKLFNEAMEGVRPISRENCVERVFRMDLPEGSRNREDAETLAKLVDLIRSGIGFNILDTPEYIEGTGYNVHPEVARRLHRGDFSIQAHVDLHGLIAEDAREVFEKFLKWAVMTGRRGVLIIHGRGLSSPAEPVLKKKVVEWLTHGPWRKWVIAYASARSCDGGAGATYVLIRERPVSKRLKTRSKRRFTTFFN